MIERYTRAPLAEIWSDEGKYRRWLEVELAVCEVHAENGTIPREALETIRSRAGFDVKRIDEIEAEVRHDVIAFLTNVAEHVGPDSRWVHYGMTSSDVLDTALALQTRDAGRELTAGVAKVAGSKSVRPSPSSSMASRQLFSGCMSREISATSLAASSLLTTTSAVSVLSK